MTNHRKLHTRSPTKKAAPKTRATTEFRGYDRLLGGIADVLKAGRRHAAWSVNTIMSAVYWDIGRRIVEFEQKGKAKAEYGERVIEVLAGDLTRDFGRGFRTSNLYHFRSFFLSYQNIFHTLCGKSSDPNLRPAKTHSGEAASASLILHTVCGKSSGQTPSSAKADSIKVSGASPIFHTLSGKSLPAHLSQLADAFALPWSHYKKLLSLRSDEARAFYETEALRGGWTFRELDRQIATQLYERLALSQDKAAVLRKARGQAAEPLSAEDEMRDPLVLEFLNLKDEYSESDLEEALIQHLSQFLVELGNDFCYVARQRRLRVGGEWYRVDLVFFHRKLRCLIVIDLKVGKFSHADAGQMHLYLNYARQHWTQPHENPPVGLILCAEKDDAVARYALEGLPNKVLAREYKLALPDERKLAAEINKTRDFLERRTRK